MRDGKKEEWVKVTREMKGCELFEVGKAYEHYDSLGQDAYFIYLGKSEHNDLLLRCRDNAPIIVSGLELMQNPIGFTAIRWGYAIVYGSRDSLGVFDFPAFTEAAVENRYRLREAVSELEAIRDDAYCELADCEDSQGIKGLEAQIATINRVLNTFFGIDDIDEIKFQIGCGRYDGLSSRLS